MVQNVTGSFKRMDVCGASKQEALAKAPFEIMGDATQAYKNWCKKQTNGITDADIKQFMLEYLQKKSKSVANAGFYIVKDAAVADTRERPYVIEDVVNELGARSWGNVFQFVDDATNAIIAETSVTFVPKMEKVLDANGEAVLGEDGKPIMQEAKDEEGNPVMVMKCATKANAKELGRELYTEAGYKGNLTCYQTKQVVKGQNIAFRMKYTPSKNARQGTYTVFGYEMN